MYIFGNHTASRMPIEAKKNGVEIIEINIKPSNYTNTITNIFLQGKASEILKVLVDEVRIY